MSLEATKGKWATGSWILSHQSSQCDPNIHQTSHLFFFGHQLNFLNWTFPTQKNHGFFQDHGVKQTRDSHSPFGAPGTWATLRYGIWVPSKLTWLVYNHVYPWDGRPHPLLVPASGAKDLASAVDWSKRWKIIAWDIWYVWICLDIQISWPILTRTMEYHGVFMTLKNKS